MGVWGVIGVTIWVCESACLLEPMSAYGWVGFPVVAGYENLCFCKPVGWVSLGWWWRGDSSPSDPNCYDCMTDF